MAPIAWRHPQARIVRAPQAASATAVLELLITFQILILQETHLRNLARLHLFLLPYFSHCSYTCHPFCPGNPIRLL